MTVSRETHSVSSPPPEFDQVATMEEESGKQDEDVANQYQYLPGCTDRYSIKEFLDAFMDAENTVDDQGRKAMDESSMKMSALPKHKIPGK